MNQGPPPFQHAPPGSTAFPNQGFPRPGIQQWSQQTGGPARYPLGPGGQMMPGMYQQQAQQGIPPNSSAPGTGPQMFPRMSQPPQQMMRPGGFPVQQGAHQQPPRMMQQPHHPSTHGPVQFMQGPGHPPPPVPSQTGAIHHTSQFPHGYQHGADSGNDARRRPQLMPQNPTISSQLGSGSHMGPPNQPHHSHLMSQPISSSQHGRVTKKKKRLSDKLLTDKIQDIVPESQAYIELLQFEKKIDETIMRKRLEVQEIIKKPLKQKKKLRIFINSSFFPAKPDSEEPDARTPSWELRVEGRLLDDPSTGKVADPSKFRRKFSSFFKSLVIELDKNIYGPENYLVEWHRTATTQETDGFQVKRPGEQDVVCKLHFMLDYQPPQFKLESRLARLLGIHTQTRTAIIMALWQYIRTHRLQDPHERDIVICDKYLAQIFNAERIRLPEIPQLITGLLLPPEPIVVQHVVAVGPGEGQTDAKRTSCYDIEVEVDDPLISSMHRFIVNISSQQEIAQLDSKIIETVDLINKSKTAREFYSGFANDPQNFIDKWLASQSADLKAMTDCEGNPEFDRRSSVFSSDDPTTREAVMRYFFNRVHHRRAELEQALAGK